MTQKIARELPVVRKKSYGKCEVPTMKISIGSE